VVKHGEVWWAEHPTAGRRPVLVLTRTEAISVLNEILVVPATRTVRGIPTEVELDQDDGMPSVCVLSLDNVTPLPKGLLIERITALTPARLREVCLALGAAVNC
jgi:mRNA interferase MazF